MKLVNNDQHTAPAFHSRRGRKARLRTAVWVPWLLLLFFPLVMPVPSFAATEKEILSNLKREEDKAAERKSTLNRLTQQERTLHSSLAAVEDNILRLEKSLDEQRTKLRGLARTGAEAEAEYDALLKERKKSEQAMAELLRALWELGSRRESVGGRDLEEWTVTDREYYWTAELFAALDEHRAEIERQQVMLDEVAARRNAVNREILTAMERIEAEKAGILSDRVKYEQQLTAVRKQKRNTQAELDSAIKLIDNLNFDLQTARTAGVDIAQAKGKLVWPASGKLALKFQPSATPPVQGVGISTASAAGVRAVHGGKVMYNDTMRGLGQVVVLQHGEAYFTVYAFLSESAVRQGQSVTRGQEIGKSGYYPALKANGVYFELRHHQKPVNPEPWLAPAS